MPRQYKITTIVQQTDEQEEFNNSPHRWDLDFMGNCIPSDMASTCQIDVEDMDFDSDLSTDIDLIEEG